MSLDDRFFFRPAEMVGLGLHDGDGFLPLRLGFRRVELVSCAHIERARNHRDMLNAGCQWAGTL